MEVTSPGNNCSVQPEVTNNMIWEPNTKHLGHHYLVKDIFQHYNGFISNIQNSNNKEN